MQVLIRMTKLNPTVDNFSQLQVRIDRQRCISCGFCRTALSYCPGEDHCVACGACVAACPAEARSLVLKRPKNDALKIWIDSEPFEIPASITVLEALNYAGFRVHSFPGGGDIYAPCRTGGCWSCAIMINGKLQPSCVTPVQSEMRIEADITEESAVRVVSGFQGHPVGGVGTPYDLKTKGSFIEVAGFTHGCILRCPTCQNWHTTYSSRGTPLTPHQTAKVLTRARHSYGVDRIAISGGEGTLNRPWLTQLVTELRSLNADPNARIHVDTNAAVLTRDYIDDLVMLGMTDIGPDIKGLELATFSKITGIKDPELAKKLHSTEWNAVKHLLDHYFGEIFIGVGIPYNTAFISLKEIEKIGDKLASWEPSVQVCVLDYRPEFRALNLVRPAFEEMIQVKRTLEQTGLTSVICQTIWGHIGPNDG
jgi:pyruvate formate lyase activating enzyme